MDKGLIIHTPKEIQDRQIRDVFTLFAENINPTINYGNKTNRKAVTYLVKRFGFQNILVIINYAISIQGDKYAPVITTPYQLKEKMGALFVYRKRNEQQQIQNI